MANAAGGEIRLGVSDDGARRPGVDPDVASALDPSRLSDLVDGFIRPDHLELNVVAEGADDLHRVVVCIRVPSFSDPPLVFAKTAQCQGQNGKPQTVFRQGDVYRRKGTKAEPASRQDYREWKEAAVAAENERWRSRVAVLSSLPPGAVLEVRTQDGETVEEPVSRLRRAVAQYRDDPTKLLSGRDLLAAFVSRDATHPDDATYELLIQSALRRKATLPLWLALAEPTPERVRQILDAALMANDRDKSDAGRSIVDVAALYLEDSAYKEVIEGLAASRYAHFREAAEAGRDRTAVLQRVDEVHAMVIDGTELGSWSEQHLMDEASRLAGILLQQTHGGSSRRLSAVGTELLLRRDRR